MEKRFRGLGGERVFPTVRPLVVALHTRPKRAATERRSYTFFQRDFDVGVGYFLYGGYICCRSLVHLFGISFIVVCVRGIFDV